MLGALVEHLDTPLRVDPVGGRHGRDRDVGPTHDALAPRGVEGDDAPPAVLRFEEGEFRREVLLHVCVVVEVVVAEVRERDDIEKDAVDPVLAEGLRAHLHGDRADLAFPHPGEKSVEFAGLRGREPAHDGEVADVALRGGTESCDEPQLTQNSLEQVRGRGLTVGAGDSEEQRRVDVRLVHPRGDVAECRSRGFDDDGGEAGPGGQDGAVPVGQECHRTLLPRLGRVGRSVAVLTGEPHEEVSGVHLARANGDAADLDAIDRPLEVEPELRDESGEGPWGWMLGTQDRGYPISHNILFLTRSSGSPVLESSTAGPGRS